MQLCFTSLKISTTKKFLLAYMKVQEVTDLTLSRWLHKDASIWPDINYQGL
jgi:hypothetical protein